MSDASGDALQALYIATSDCRTLLLWILGFIIVVMLSLVVHTFARFSDFFFR